MRVLFGKHSAVGQRYRAAVELDCTVVGERGQRAVARQRPGAALIYGQDYVIFYSSAASLVFDYIDRAGEGSAVSHRHIERGDSIDGYVAGKHLRVGGEIHVSAVCARRAPAAAGRVAFYREQLVVGKRELHAAQADVAVGIGHVYHIAAERGQAAAGHAERRSAYLSVAGHALIDHDVVDVLVRIAVVCARHAACGGAVDQRDRILALHNHGFRIIGGKRRVAYGYVSRGVYRGRAGAVGGVGAAVHVDSSAAAVGANRRRRVAAGGYGKVGRIGRAAAGGLDAARVILVGGYRRVTYVDRRALAIAEHAVAVLGAGADGNRDRAADARQYVLWPCDA